MASTYTSFQELARQAREGEDYVIRVALRPSSILVIAPHGGKIEAGTTELAEAIASADYSFYSLVGLKPSATEQLHLTSRWFDEPRALQAAARAWLVVAVHGHSDPRGAYVMVGGLHAVLARRVQDHLAESGFRLRKPPHGLSGIHPANICNRGRSGRGVQLELSTGLRHALRHDRARFEAFVAAVRAALGTDA